MEARTLPAGLECPRRGAYERPPNHEQSALRPVPPPFRRAQLDYLKAPTHCGGFRLPYDCKMRNLGVPFCAVCCQVIWNRIRP